MNMKLLDLADEANVRMSDAASYVSGQEDEVDRDAQVHLDRDRVYIVLSGDVFIKPNDSQGGSPARSPFGRALAQRSPEGTVDTVENSEDE